MSFEVFKCRDGSVAAIRFDDPLSDAERTYLKAIICSVYPEDAEPVAAGNDWRGPTSDVVQQFAAQPDLLREGVTSFVTSLLAGASLEAALRIFDRHRAPTTVTATTACDLTRKAVADGFGLSEELAMTETEQRAYGWHVVLTHDGSEYEARVSATGAITMLKLRS